MPQPHERHMTPINDRRAALAFVTQYASTALSAGSTQSAASLANWILLNRTGIEPGDLPAADDEYRAERADWQAERRNLDAFLAPASGDEEFEDGVSRGVVLELLARKIKRLRSLAQGRAILARMMAAVCSAAHRARAALPAREISAGLAQAFCLGAAPRPAGELRADASAHSPGRRHRVARCQELHRDARRYRARHLRRHIPNEPADETSN